MNRLFKKKYNIKVVINNKPFTIPNEHHIFYTLHEVFTWKLYRKLIGCTHVLDLGGFIGDTGVWLSEYNDEVTIYEPNPSNFSFLEKNISNFDNIKAYNGAVIGDTNATSYYYEGGDFNAGGKIVTSPTDIKITTYHIQDILSSHLYDGLKMDIEGGEYDIINYFMQNPLFTFKKGYIEFHYYHDNKKNKELIDTFITYLDHKGYTVVYENVYGKVINREQINTLDPQIFVLYFSQ